MSNALGAGAPGAGGDQGGFLQWLQGLAPGAQSAIMRVMAQANPVSSANAATANPLNNPSPVPPALAAGGPPVPDSLVGHGDGPPPPPPPVVAAPPAPIAPVVGGGSSGGGGASGGIGSDARFPVAAAPGTGGIGSDARFPVGPYATPPLPPVRPKNLGAAPVARVRAHIDPRATALAAGGGALPGYYAPTTGNARGSTWSPYTDPNDPRIFRGGPLAAR